MFAAGKKFLVLAALALSAAFAAPAVLAAEPTVDQVYLAAQGGRYIEAQTMLDQVLQAHPKSAKAHYIQAVVYAKQGLMSKASSALTTADTLDPAGKYASPTAVKALRDVIAAPRPSLSDNRAVPPSATSVPQQVQRQAPPPAERSFPWGLLLGGLALVGFIVWVSRMMSQRNANMQAANGGPMYNGNGAMQSYPGGAYGPTGGAGGYPPPGYGPGYGGMPGQAPGMGSRIMGGLATGAAVGAGIVAGEALMHKFTDNDRNSGNANAAPNPGNDFAPAPSYDMGGNDFGVSDTSSWDSGGGGGDSGDSGGSWD